jgi:hypothetical protein
MACTRDSSPISNRGLTHRRRAVVCRHSHHANTSFSTKLGLSLLTG